MYKYILAFFVVFCAFSVGLHQTITYAKDVEDQNASLKAQLLQITESQAEKIERLKYELVDDLAAKCETKDSKDPDGVIIFDSNNKPSLGAWQWQTASIQHYVKLFEDKEISRSEAISLAVDHDKARELTKRVIFEDSKGVENWFNCANKLNLRARIEIIKNLE